MGAAAESMVRAARRWIFICGRPNGNRAGWWRTCQKSRGSPLCLVPHILIIASRTSHRA